MKRLLRNMWLGMLAVAVVALSGCTTDPDPEPVIPKIQISEINSDFTSVTFTISTTDAVRYTYAVALEGATGTPVEVKDMQTSKHTVSDLEAGKKYTISAYAYAADGSKSEEAKASFETDPRATLKIDEFVEVSRTSAMVTLIPSNATGISYVCYEKAEKPAELKWIEVKGNAKVTVEIKDLKMKTEYQVDAFATNADGDSDVVSVTFTTSDVVGLKIATMPATLLVSFDFDKEIYGGLYRSTLFDKDDTELDESMKSFDNYLAYVKELLAGGTEDMLDKVSETNKWTSVTPGSGRADNTYQMYVIMLDKQGKIMETSEGYTLSVKQTAPADVTFGKGVAKATLSDVQFKDMTINYKLALSDDAVWYEVGSIEAREVGDKDLAEVVLGNLKTMGYPKAASELADANGQFTAATETEYYIYAVAYDKAGRMGELVSQKGKTTAIAYDESVTAKLEVTSELFSSVTFKCTITGNPEKVRYNLCTLVRFEDDYKSEEKELIADMCESWYDTEIEADDQGMWTLVNGLEYSTDYVLFTIPVKEDGTFGQPARVDFATAKYVAGGDGVVTITEVARGTDRPAAGVANNYITYKITPGANCELFRYGSIYQEIYDSNSKRIGQYMAKAFDLVWSQPAQEVEVKINAISIKNPDGETTTGEAAYLGVLIGGSNDKWSTNDVLTSVVPEKPYFDGLDINGNPID